jgi:hypothetical protein
MGGCDREVAMGMERWRAPVEQTVEMLWRVAEYAHSELVPLGCRAIGQGI